MDDSPAHEEQALPVWAAFGDLMAAVLGAFVLLLALALVSQLELAERLQAEVAQRQAAERERAQLAQALAGPLAEGRVSLRDGRIGIAGNLLFAPGADQLHPEGQALLAQLAGPLRDYLAARGELLMVSGFTDDRAVRAATRQYADNWELSAQRALSVTRGLIEHGLPADAVFAAAFGQQQPVADNAQPAGRAQNRRVELAPMPRRAP